MSYMTSIAVQTAEFFEAPKLRLLPSSPHPSSASLDRSPRDRDTDGDAHAGAHAGQPTLRLQPKDAPEVRSVLVAGGDSDQRAAVLGDLAGTLPASTRFAEADAFWEVLVQAPSSSMVVLSGDLDDLPAESLLQMLAHRHPGLPVVSVAAASSTPG
jgi:hypothetical protein